MKKRKGEFSLYSSPMKSNGVNGDNGTNSAASFAASEKVPSSPDVPIWDSYMIMSSRFIPDHSFTVQLK